MWQNSKKCFAAMMLTWALCIYVCCCTASPSFRPPPRQFDLQEFFNPPVLPLIRTPVIRDLRVWSSSMLVSSFREEDRNVDVKTLKKFSPSCRQEHLTIVILTFVSAATTVLFSPAALGKGEQLLQLKQMSKQ